MSYVGIRIAARYYNSSLNRNDSLDTVLFGKILTEEPPSGLSQPAIAPPRPYPKLPHQAPPPDRLDALRDTSVAHLEQLELRLRADLEGGEARLRAAIQGNSDRLAALEQRMDRPEQRIDRLEQRVDTLKTEMTERFETVVEERFRALELRMTSTRTASTTRWSSWLRSSRS